MGSIAQGALGGQNLTYLAKKARKHHVNAVVELLGSFEVTRL